MNNDEKLKQDLIPFIEMVSKAKESSNKDFLNAVDDFKNLLIDKKICNIQENPLLLDKLIDEVLESENK
jgi:hypothetical protein